jgi:hypothetical protein
LGDRDHLLGLLDRVGEGLRDRFGAHVAAGDGPFVVLFGEDGADEPDDRRAVGEDADDVGAAADLLVQPLERVVRPELAPVLLGE